MGSKLTIDWRYFSLEQVNSQQGPQWKIWEQPPGYVSRGLLAFRAAQAARQQGEAAFNSFHIALLKAKHEKREDIADIDTIINVAESVNLQMARFKEDLGSPQLLAKLGEDHTFAIRTLGVFGTPTLVFPERQAIFLKLAVPPSIEDSLAVFTELSNLARRRECIMAIKRPESAKVSRPN